MGFAAKEAGHIIPIGNPVYAGAAKQPGQFPALFLLSLIHI